MDEQWAQVMLPKVDGACAWQRLPTTMTTILTIHEADVLARQATHLVGTLGHVAEGKSTFIRALTGVKTQRHAKEQERNITIHLGYANCRVYQNIHTGELRAIQTKDAPPTPAADWLLTAHLSFVDCPGHEAYLATMLGGASIMDTACLIVASTQEVIPQPQTLEHLVAAELMGLTRLAVLQNKLDLITPAAARANNAKISAFARGTIAETAPRIPIAAQHGWGVDRVLEWVSSLAPPPRDLHAPARLTCVRSFDVNRPGPWIVPSIGAGAAAAGAIAGAVIGGTLDQGVLAIGDWLEIRPGVLSVDDAGEIIAQPLMTQVRGIRCEAAELPYAIPGSLIAIATDLDPALSIANGMVGQRVGVPGTLPPIVSKLTLKYKCLDRHGSYDFPPQAPGTEIKICSNVMTVDATVVKVDERGRLEVSLSRPLCIGKGEHVGIMRFHHKAGRELLEGAGEVVRTMDWWNIADAEGAELAAPPDRTVVWVPMERPEWVVRTPSYEEMLAAVMARKAEMGGAAVRKPLDLPDIQTERTKHYTNWTTYGATVAALDAAGVGDIPYEKHFRGWVEADLRTAIRATAEGVMEIRGRYRVEDLASLRRRYVAAFKQCAECSGYNTGLVKERILKIRCKTCNCDILPGE
jgi:translation initiation factor 2 subunit 3